MAISMIFSRSSFVSVFGYLSRSKRSSLNIDEGGGHVRVLLSLVYFESCITVRIAGGNLEL